MIKLIHDITQLGYIVSFHNDFEGMVRIEFIEEYNDDFYEHYHVGIPDGSMARLEEEINHVLVGFIKEHKDV